MKMYETVQRLARCQDAPWQARTPRDQPEMCVRADQAIGFGMMGVALAVSSANGSDHPIVLIVEDNFFVRQDIARYLEEWGCLVLEAATTEQAAAVCRSQTPVDVLFTDINLNGGGSGWEVAQGFRTARPGIAVLYTSGNSVDRSRCVPDSLFFSKPYRLSDILDACRGRRIEFSSR